MNNLRWGVLLVALCCAPASARKPKVEKPPTQDDVIKGCIAVQAIRSTTQGWSSGAGLSAVVHSECQAAATISITIAYFDRYGTQYGTGYENITVAPGAFYPVVHVPLLDSIGLALMKSARVISVNGYTH